MHSTFSDVFKMCVIVACDCFFVFCGTRSGSIEILSSLVLLHCHGVRMAHRSNALQEEKILGLESKLSRAEKRAADYEKLQLEHQVRGFTSTGIIYVDQRGYNISVFLNLLFF